MLKRGWLCIFLLVAPSWLFGQSAELSGYVKDPTGANVPNATVELRNQETGVRHQTTTNQEGVYSLPALKPGTYVATVQAQGFKTLTREAIVLNTAERASIDFSLQVGSASETVTVTDEAPLINESLAVATVVDRQFVENIPLNGRSFQSLIALAPGVVTTKTSFSSQGQFSVNGQRADANYFTVDGVSANAGISAGGPLVQSAAGGLPELSVAGGTQSFVSVDALQEFTI